MSFVNIIDIIYLIGTVYTSFSSTSPAEIFGGTWEQIKTFLYGQDNAGNTGGSKDHYHALNDRGCAMLDMGPSGGNDYFILKHKYSNYSGLNTTEFGSPGGTANGYYVRSADIGKNPSENYTAGVALNGRTASVVNVDNNAGLPPYTTCYIWRRTT